MRPFLFELSFEAKWLPTNLPLTFNVTGTDYFPAPHSENILHAHKVTTNMLLLLCYNVRVIKIKKSHIESPKQCDYSDHNTSSRSDLRIYYVKLLATVAVGINAIATVAVTTVTRQQD